MKKSTLLLLSIMVTMATVINAQKTPSNERSVYRKGYIRLGISTLGNSLNNSLSPKANVSAGNYGAGTGYALDFGHIYYFRNRSAGYKVNFGLDWTILSATYSKLDKWDAYGTASGVPGAPVTGSSVAIASKLGPVISFNPFEKLLIDVRFQVGYQARYSDLDYYDHTGSAMRSFIFGNPDNETISTRLGNGIATSFGFTIRRKAIGFSLDYISSKPNTTFIAKEAGGSQLLGKQEITTNELQLKLSLTL